MNPVANDPTRHLRTVQAAGVGRTVVRIRLLSPLSSAEVPILLRYVENEYRRVGNATYGLGGFSSVSLVSVEIVGVTADQNARGYVKTFNMALVRDMRANLQNTLTKWSVGFWGPNFDYSITISELKFVFVSRVGGCGRVTLTPDSDGRIWRSHIARFNNCFFTAIGAEGFRVARLSRLYCNDLRATRGLPPDSPIPANDALELFRGFGSVCIQTDAGWIPNEPASDDVLIRLNQGHYYRFWKMKKIQTKCRKCHKMFANRHSCPYDKWGKCLECGGPHDSKKDCHVDQLRFYQREILKTKVKILNNRRKDEKRVVFDNVLHYDIESYPDKNQVHQPYLLGCKREGYDYTVFGGKNCIAEFLDYALAFDEDLYLNAFNGANFDHYFVVKEMLRRGKVDNFKLCNGSLIDGEFCKLKFFDIRKHCVGSLKANLESWKCKVKKGDFDHEQGCAWEEMSPDVREKCLVYLESDVLGLLELYHKMNAEMFKSFAVNIHNYLSTSQLSFRNWLQRNKKRIELPTLHQELAFREAIFGGRVYKCKHEFISEDREGFIAGEVEFDDIKDYIIDLDVVSLYPAAMAHHEYPIGHVEAFLGPGNTNRYMSEHNKLEFMGIYHIKFTPNLNLAHSILPRREATGLVWDLKPGEGWYTSVDINLALRFGYEVEVVKGGWFWRETFKIFKEYIEDAFTRKQNAEKGTPTYLVMKLVMNGLYGKLIQRPILDETHWCLENEEVFELNETHDILEVEFFHDQVYVRGSPKSRKKLASKITKPTHLGAFVLSYSRLVMLDYLEKSNPHFNSSNIPAKVKNDIYYTDTDSIQVHARNGIAQSRELGGIADDLGAECKILRGYWIAPKLYMLEYIKRGSDELFYHFRGKGVPQDSLKEEVFAWMNDGKSIATCRDFAMKKIHTRRNSKQVHLELFSILHNTWKDTLRTLNKTPWVGRHFIEGGSLPHH